jgi:hypothetical protein
MSRAEGSSRRGAEAQSGGMKELNDISGAIVDAAFHIDGKSRCTGHHASHSCIVNQL